MTGDLIEPKLTTIKAGQLDSVSDTKFKDVELVGGYNWIEAKQPSILVPGMFSCHQRLVRAEREVMSDDVSGLPNLWVSSSQGRLGQLKPDINIPGHKEMANRKSCRLPSVLYKVSWTHELNLAENGYRLLPKISTFEPIFHSLDPPQALNDIELITDRNSLRKLFQMFTPDALHGQKPFRINSQLVGETVLFSRTEAQKMIMPQTPHPFCFAKSHQLATCEQQVEGAPRVIRLSDTRLVVSR